MKVSDFVAEFLQDVSGGVWTPSILTDIANVIKDDYGIQEIQKWLGQGSFGAAGAIGNDRVLKLTTDPEEINTSHYLVGHTLPNVVRIYAACYVEGIQVYHEVMDRMLRVGLVIMERLESIGTGDAYLDDILGLAVDEVKDEHRAWTDSLAKLPRREARATLIRASDDLAHELLKADDPAFTQIATAILDLYSQGVYWIDAHHKNVGYSAEDGVFKVFDLGVSATLDAPGRPAPEAPVCAPIVPALTYRPSA